MQKAFPIFAMELFCDGWLFLTHSDVTWDGSSHAVKRIRINADRRYEQDIKTLRAPAA